MKVNDFKTKWAHFCKSYDRQDYDEAMSLKQKLVETDGMKEDLFKT